jgi:ABC-2 type transport system ATP-binding protein
MLATERNLDEPRSNAQSGSGIAQLQGVSKNYDDIQALRNLDLSIRSGELLALLGPNGAGKTTAVKLLLGLARANHGTVRVFGGDPTQSSVRVRIGAMLQVARVPATLRVREHVELFASYYPHPLPMKETLALAGLMEIKDRFFGELSGGQQQKVLVRPRDMRKSRLALSRRANSRSRCRGSAHVLAGHRQFDRAR